MISLLIWICLVLVFYTFLGYPLLMAALAHGSKRQPIADLETAESFHAGASVVLCVRNAGDRIEMRVRNLLETSFAGPVEIWIYCDGCTDDTAGRVRAMGLANVNVVESDRPTGKPAGLNVCIPRCRFPWVVLCDVRQTFAPDAIAKLIARLAEPSVAAVSGRLEIQASESGGGRGVDLYWKLESWLRETEGQYDSVVGCTGAICAIQRDLFRPLPEDTLLDDVVIPMRLVADGWRVVYEPKALAFDPQTLDPKKERVRKRRTLVGNFQMIERYPMWLLPWRNRLWWQLISHKYLRLLVPWLLLVVAVASLLAPKSPLVWLLLIGQAVAYGCGMVGLLLPRFRSRLLSVPAGFLALQISCGGAFLAYLKHRKNLLTLWQPALPKSSIDLHDSRS